MFKTDTCCLNNVNYQNLERIRISERLLVNFVLHYHRYLQYDDWFYKSVGPTPYGAVVTWDALPSVFPHGIQ